MLIAAIDTETTGIIRGEYTSPDAPYLASIALIIYNTTNKRVQSSFNSMVYPDNWEMPPEAAQVNGLDTEMLEQYGLPILQVLQTTSLLLEPTDLIVAHNVAFDIKMLASGFYRNDLMSELDGLLQKDVYCTMQESKPIVQARTIRGHIKNPKLTEAFQFFFEQPLDNAHSANADVVACLEIYLALQEYQAPATPSDPTDEISL